MAQRRIGQEKLGCAIPASGAGHRWTRLTR